MLSTSTKPLHVMTDEGAALVKYMGNRAGLDALVSELLAGELAGKVGLRTPDFAVVDIPIIETSDPFVTVQPGPAFFSRWEQAQSLAPNSKLLASLRDPGDVSRLVVFDTWIRNKDRFADDPNGTLLNYDNILFKADKRKTQLLVIDHSHAFAETSLEAEMHDDWATERVVYGLFNEFLPMLKRSDVKSAIDTVLALAIEEIETICQSTPVQWGITAAVADRIAELLVRRANLMSEWMPDAIFAQLELDFDGKEE
ncbi:HipA family kinase [Neorhizobium sp. Rsf11]|uniref:HipA family kinase n=1 Tax=Neorhizobium phenanthreniclasticum TaxID=3157917 RepID=A0ABV0LVZ9_9HYPH